MLVSARPLPPVYLCLAAPLRLCAFAPLRHCPFDSLLHSPTEPSFCSFCEQKQRISGAVAHCSTWNTVHFVNRSSESVEQWPGVSRSIPPCMRVWTGALRPAPLHRCALNRCAIRAPQTRAERSSAYPSCYQAIAPLRLCFWPVFCAGAPLFRIRPVVPNRERHKMFKIGTPTENSDTQQLIIISKS
jgi:hypothetical protein